MYTCTNKEEVDAAFNAARPRAVEEVWAEYAPECTVDANGRGHAPYDGFVVPDAEYRVYRAGEYLPEPEEVDSIRKDWASSFGVKKFPEAKTLEGEYVSWQGTRAMNRAAWEVLKRQTRELELKRDAKSQHVATVGARITTDFTVDKLIKLDGVYGVSYLTIGRDAAGNVLFYKGSVKLAEVGGTVNVTATVKEHKEYEGIAQTVLARPKRN